MDSVRATTSTTMVTASLLAHLMRTTMESPALAANQVKSGTATPASTDALMNRSGMVRGVCAPRVKTGMAVDAFNAKEDKSGLKVAKAVHVLLMEIGTDISVSLAPVAKYGTHTLLPVNVLKAAIGTTTPVSSVRQVKCGLRRV